MEVAGPAISRAAAAAVGSDSDSHHPDQQSNACFVWIVITADRPAAHPPKGHPSATAKETLPGVHPSLRGRRERETFT